ncbi:beta-adaptin [Binucleata daphniae]
MKNAYKFDVINPLLLSKKTCQHIKALEMLIDGMNDKKDVSNYFMKVFQISDTRNVKLKKMINIYFLNNKFDSKLLVLTTNTLLKDLNDPNTEIRDMAIDFIGNLEYIDEYFVKNLVKIAKIGDKETRKRIAKNMVKMFDNKMHVDKYDLIGLLNEMVMDVENVYAHKVLYAICDQYSVKSLNELIAMLYTMKYPYKSQLLLLLIIYKMVKNDQSYDKNKLERVCIKFLIEPKLEAAYLSSKILINCDRNYVQLVYNTLKVYFKHGTIKTYYLLEFIREIIAKQDAYNFSYSNLDFIIYEDEPNYIKRIKMDIMCVKFDKVAKNEIKKYMNKHEMYFDCLFLSSQHMKVSKKLLKACFARNKIKTIKILYHCLPTNNRSNSTVCDEMLKHKVKPKYTYMYFYVLANVLSDYKKLQNVKIRLNEIDLSKFYLMLFYKNVINYETLKQITEHSIFSNNLVTKLINDQTTCDKIRSYCFDRKCISQKNIFEFKIFDIYKSALSYEKQAKEHVITTEDDTKCQQKETEKHFFELHTTDEYNISYKIYLKLEEICFEITRIEKPIKIVIKIATKSNTNTLLFDNVCYEPVIVKLLDTNRLFQKQELIVTNENNIKNIKIRMRNCVVPYKTDLKDFNNNFITIKNYEIIEDQLFCCKSYNVEENMFCFRFINNVFYAMSMGGQLVIKCYNQKVLEALANDLRDE